jgi:hypothetical protein
MVDVRQFFAGSTAQDILENDQGASSEDDAAACKGSVNAWFAVQHAAHVDAATAGNAAEVVELGRGKRLRDFPFAGKLANVRFAFLVNVQLRKIARASRFVDVDVGCCAVPPVPGQCVEVLNPVFPACFVRCLKMVLAVGLL